LAASPAALRKSGENSPSAPISLALVSKALALICTVRKPPAAMKIG